MESERGAIKYLCEVTQSSQGHKDSKNHENEMHVSPQHQQGQLDYHPSPVRWDTFFP